MEISLTFKDDEDGLDRAQSYLTAITEAAGLEVVPDGLTAKQVLRNNRLKAMDGRSDTDKLSFSNYLDTMGAPEDNNFDEMLQIWESSLTQQTDIPDDGYIPKQGLDKDKRPWDERIHSGSGKQKKDGSWVLRKNLDPAVKAEVEAEFTTPPPPAAEAPTTPPPPTAEAPAVEPMYEQNGVKFTTQQMLDANWSEAQIAELTPVAPDPVKATPMVTYVQYSQAVIKSKIPKDEVDAVLAQHGISNPLELRNHLDQVPSILQTLGIVL